MITRNIQRDAALRSLKDLAETLSLKAQEIATLEAQLATQKGLTQAKKAEFEALSQEIEALRLSLEALKVEHRKAAKGEFIASRIEREAYQIDGLLAAGMTLKAACELIGVSENTARARLKSLNGESLSERVRG